MNILKKKFVIKENEGVNNLRFGMAKTEVRKSYPKGFKSFRKAPEVAYDDADHYESLQFLVYYSEEGTVEAFEFSNGSNLEWRSKKLFRLNYTELKKLFEELDSDLESDEFSFTSKLYGIGACKAGRKVESIIVFPEGYYDDLESWEISDEYQAKLDKLGKEFGL